MYQFKLESLLNHKKILEEILQKELAVLNNSLLQEKGKMQSYKEENIYITADLENNQKQGITISRNLLYFDYIKQLSEKIDKKRNTIHEIENSASMKRIDLIEAVKKRKILDKLKEKGLESYVTRLNKKEQDFLNEVAINSFNRKT